MTVIAGLATATAFALAVIVLVSLYAHIVADLIATRR